MASDVYEQVLASIEKDPPSADELISFVERSSELCQMGIELDADSVCLICRNGEKVNVFLQVGRSLLVGEEIERWILEYHNFNRAAARHCKEKIALFAVEDLPGNDECIMPFVNSKNKAWRAFRDTPLKTIDEVRKRAFIKLGRPLA